VNQLSGMLRALQNVWLMNSLTLLVCVLFFGNSEFHKKILLIIFYFIEGSSNSYAIKKKDELGKINIISFIIFIILHFKLLTVLLLLLQNVSPSLIVKNVIYVYIFTYFLFHLNIKNLISRVINHLLWTIN
jgi:hypothetical protein